MLGNLTKAFFWAVGHFAKMPEFFSQNLGTQAGPFGAFCVHSLQSIKDLIQAKTTRLRWPAVPLQTPSQRSQEAHVPPILRRKKMSFFKVRISNCVNVTI